MTARFLRALPLFVAAVALWRAGPEALPAAAIGLVLLLFVAIGPRVRLDKPTQRLAGLVVLILVIAGVRAAGIAVRGGARLGAFAFGFAVAPLCVATMRLHFVEPDWGYVFTLMLGFIGMMACGAVRLGPVYGALVAAYLAAMIAALRMEDASRVPATRVPRKGAAVGALIVALSCLFTVGAALVLRPLQQYVQGRINDSFQEHMLSRVAFSDSMHLGRMAPMLKSNRIVLRIRGPRVDRLRGAVLDQYDGRRWLREGGGAPTPLNVERGPLHGPDVVEIHKVGDDGDRIFLPFDVSAVAVAPGSVKADGYGIARAVREGEDVTWLKTGKRAVLPIADAGMADRRLGRELARPLRALALKWADGTETPEETLAAIERHLHADFTYSTATDRSHLKGDPLFDFLFRNRVGHCEYFASAMALLARAVGIPTRVVTGYRVGEHNPYLGHYVVRERNAHAWVEAWLPDRGWVTYDPTPMAELAHDEPFEESGATALSELFAAGVGRIEDWLAERTVGELSLAAVLGLIVFAIVRALGAKKIDPARGTSLALEFSSPLDAYIAFEARLAKGGLRREENEALERFAERVPDGDRGLVLRYARTRYGVDRDDRIEADLRASAQAE